MQLQDLAQKIAARYARRCWWVEREELEARAMLAGVEARRTFDPNVGVDEGAYLWRAMVYACRRQVWSDSAPVSASCHSKPKLAGLHRAELTEGLVDPGVDPHTQVAAAELVAKVRQHVLALADRTGHHLGVDVVLGARTPAQVAADEGVEVQRVYRARQYLKEAMANDYTLFQLWKEM